MAAFALYRVVEDLAKPTAFQPVSWTSAVAARLDPRAPADEDYDAETEEYWDGDGDSA